MSTRSEGTGRAIHPIGVVAERTGLSTDVIRVWERRYGVVEPARDEGGRRMYSDADVERLRLLEQAVSGGRSIGQVADLPSAELAELVRADEAARWQVSRPASPETREGAEALVERAFERTEALDAAGLAEVLERGASLLGLPSFLERVVAPLFREIGEAWHAGRLGVVHEHLATGVALPLMARLRDRLASGPRAPLVVVGTPVGERHEIGALIAAAAAAGEGWRVLYLGSELPAGELAEAAREAEARAVALSVIYGEKEALAEEVGALLAALDGDADVLLGGPGAPEVASTDDRVVALDDLEALRRYLREGGG